MRKKEKQKKRKAYEPKLTPEGNFTIESIITLEQSHRMFLHTYLLCFCSIEMMDSSTFKRFTASIDNILENLEDVDFTATGADFSLFNFQRF